MKVLLGIFITLIMSVASADCTLPDGSNVTDCQEKYGSDNNEAPNTLIHWTQPTLKENGKDLAKEDIENSRVYFQRLHDNWWSNYTFEGGLDNSLYIYKPPEVYSIIVTFFGDGGLESAPTDAVVYTIKDSEVVPPIDPPIDPPITPPQPPLILTVSEGFKAVVPEDGSTITITPVDGGAQ